MHVMANSVCAEPAKYRRERERVCLWVSVYERRRLATGLKELKGEYYMNSSSERERERGRGRQRERQRDRDRETDTERQRQTDRHTQTYIHTHTQTHTDTHTHTHTPIEDAVVTHNMCGKGHNACQVVGHWHQQCRNTEEDMGNKAHREESGVENEQRHKHPRALVLVVVDLHDERREKERGVCVCKRVSVGERVSERVSE